MSVAGLARRDISGKFNVILDGMNTLIKNQNKQRVKNNSFLLHIKCNKNLIKERS
jgi:hypothetical protein